MTTMKKTTIKLDIAQPATITTASCVDGTIVIDQSQLPAPIDDGAELMLKLSVRRIHEKFQYRQDYGTFPFLTTSYKHYKVQSSTWSVQDTSLKALKLGNKRVDVIKDEASTACAFSLAPALLMTPHEEENDGLKRFIFQLDGNLLQSRFLTPTRRCPMERDLLYVTASLLYVQPHKNSRSIWIKKRQKSQRKAFPRLDRLRSTESSRPVLVPQESEEELLENEKFQPPTHYRWRKRDVLLCSNAD